MRITENGKRRWKKAVAAVLMAALAITGITAPAVYADEGIRYTDVPEYEWYYTYIYDLSTNGVVNGYPDGTFKPDAKVTCGEALKLILRETGVEEQTAGSIHWASGYLDYAVSKGYLEAGEITDLDAVMDRAMIARVAAQAMGLAQESFASPFADTEDGWVLTLYQEKILTGSIVNGQRIYLPKDGIKRSEISAIIWRIGEWKKQKAEEPAVTDTEWKKVDCVYWSQALKPLDIQNYDLTNFVKDDRGRLTYDSKSVETITGIDVSSWQGDIDWEEVAADGIDFAILRVGYRGYGTGIINADTCFEKNLKGAQAAGLDVGVYFYSQAITPAEAKEEAEYVLTCLDGTELAYPVVFDWEIVGGEAARTYGMDTDLLCACADTFCDLMEDVGYETMIYFTKYLAGSKYNMKKMEGKYMWFAEYTATPTYDGVFHIWQYSSKGTVNGIEGDADMDLILLKK